MLKKNIYKVSVWVAYPKAQSVQAYRLVQCAFDDLTVDGSGKIQDSNGNETDNEFIILSGDVCTEDIGEYFQSGYDLISNKINIWNVDGSFFPYEDATNFSFENNLFKITEVI